MNFNYSYDQISGFASRFSQMNAFPLLVTVWLWAHVVVGFILAVAVQRDAQKRMQSPEGLFLNSPSLWFGIVLLTGSYAGALAYWLIHYSSMRHRNLRSNKQGSQPKGLEENRLSEISSFSMVRPPTSPGIEDQSSL